MAENGLRRRTADASTASVSPTADHVYRLLADDERRALLGLLADGDDVSLSDLRAHITDDGATEHADIRLHHIHLPKLTDADLVRRDDDTVSLTPRGRTVVDRIEV